MRFQNEQNKKNKKDENEDDSSEQHSYKKRRRNWELSASDINAIISYISRFYGDFSINSLREKIFKEKQIKFRKN
jgi:hypothetical protein